MPVSVSTVAGLDGFGGPGDGDAGAVEPCGEEVAVVRREGVAGLSAGE